MQDLNSKNLENLDNSRQIINKKSAIRELEFDEALFYNILDTFVSTTIDRVAERVAFSISYDYYQQAIDNLNGLIASCEYFQGHYLHDQSLVFRALLKTGKKDEICKEYQLWIECLVYTKIQAIKFLNDKKIPGFDSSDIISIVKSIVVLDEYIILTDLDTGHFYCLKEKQTKSQRIEELQAIGEARDPGREKDIDWILKKNIFSPLKFKFNVSDIKIQDIEWDYTKMMPQIEDDKNVSCGCQIGSTCRIF
ncbi:UNKNOWN [Stylonychia lemnae]|uniref:Uncharacterized protein n=1 Tax=Stylonychia lemnae TaxID=5949 RepID=A0A078A123_STYLE|nr:UNKNOWN [Stylonychia lemnae]|eukprot:CDW75921.1 UNKNOWN [Stylonychia lemnae]